MKKLLLSVVFFGALLFPSVGMAQTVDQTQLDSLKAQLITLLTQEIAALQAQLDSMLASQNQTEALVANLSQSRVSLPSIEEDTSTNVSFGSPVCIPDETVLVKIPVTVIGSGWDKITYSYDPYNVFQDNQPTSMVLYHDRYMTVGQAFSQRNIEKNPNVYVINQDGDYHFTGTVLDSSGQVLSAFSQTVTIADQCPNTGISFLDK